VRILRNIKGKLFHDGSYSVCGGQAPSYNTVAKWSKWFHKNCEEIEHETCLLRSVTETSSENIDEVRCLIENSKVGVLSQIALVKGKNFRNGSARCVNEVPL